MPSFNEFIAQGNGWLFFPFAVLLGAIHGLEPGHSKTMMSAFIIAIRGTVWQAFLLGLSATISHTAIIWVLAFVGLYYGKNLNVEELEPYFQLATGVIVVGLAFWMLYRTRQVEKQAANHQHSDDHNEMLVNTGHGFVQITVFETGVPPRFRLYFLDSKKVPIAVPSGQTITIETIRDKKSRQLFQFEQKGDYLEATTELPEPHEFQAILELKHGGHGHTYEVNFTEHHHHEDLGSPNDQGFVDAHEQAHTLEMQKQLANRDITTGQIILFGLTGGLLPCPSAFAVLLICLQLKKVALGFAMVLAFSLGLAITLVSVGAIAALSVKHASKKFKGFSQWARKLPYASSTIMIILGTIIAVQGVRHLIK